MDSENVYIDLINFQSMWVYESECWIKKLSKGRRFENEDYKNLHWDCIIDLSELFKDNMEIINVICNLDSSRLYFYLPALFSDQVRVKEIVSFEDHESIINNNK